MLGLDTYLYLSLFSPLHNVQFPPSSWLLSMCNYCILTDSGSNVRLSFPFFTPLLKYFLGDLGFSVVLDDRFVGGGKVDQTFEIVHRVGDYTIMTPEGCSYTRYVSFIEWSPVLPSQGTPWFFFTSHLLSAASSHNLSEMSPSGFKRTMSLISSGT